MDTIGKKADPAGRTRRRHSEEFKAKAVTAARVAGVSSAAVAMAYGVNANLLRRWVQKARGGADGAVIEVAAASAAATNFVPVQLPAQAPADIRIEVRRGPMLVSVSWPCDAATQCATWLRELLR